MSKCDIIDLVLVPSPFRPDVERHCIEHTGGPLASYIDERTNRLVLVDGEIIHESDWATMVPKPGAEIVVRDRPGFFVIPIWIAIVATVIAGVVSTLIMIGINLIMSLFKPKPAKNDDTPTYNWEGPQLTAQQGLVIPKGYGTFRTSGNVVTSYVTGKEKKSWMNLLMSMGYGTAVSITDIKINDIDVDDMIKPDDCVLTYKRMGYADQDVIPLFNELIVDHGMNFEFNYDNTHEEDNVTNMPMTVFVGQRDDVTSIEVEITFPQGLYWSDDKGKIQTSEMGWQAEISSDGGTTWATPLVPLDTTVVSPGDDWVAISDDQFEGGSPTITAHASAVGAAAHYEGEPYTETRTVDYYDIDGVTRLGTKDIKLVGHWTKNPSNPLNGATGMAAGSVTTSTGNWTLAKKATKAATRDCYHDSIKFSNLTAGRYSVRVVKNQENGRKQDPKDLRIMDKSFVTSVREGVPDTYSYNGLILLGMKLLATSRISGSNVNITALVQYGAPESVGYKNSVAYERPQIFYRLTDATGLTARDASGRGFDGTYGSGVTLQQATLVTKSPAKSAKFDGTSNAKITGPNPVLSTDGVGFAIDVWLKLATVAAFDIAADAAGQGWRVDSTGLPYFRIGATNQYANTKLCANEVNHLALHVVGNVVTFILNGVMDGTHNILETSLTVTAFLTSLNGWAQNLVVYAPAPRKPRFRSHYEVGASRLNLLEEVRSNNPAVVLVDMIVSKEYGGDIDYDRVMETQFKEFADYCDELVPDGKGTFTFRHSFDGVFDTQQSLWEQLTRVAASARATPIMMGTRYGVVWDAPCSPVQMFGQGNTLKGTFRETWLALSDLSTQVDVQFNDREDLVTPYGRVPLTVELDEDIAAGVPPKKGPAIDLFGVTEECRAVREGTWYLRANKLNKRTLTWDADIDAVHAKLGDAVLVANNTVSRWGATGRIASGGGTIMHLDQEVEVKDDGTFYKLTVRHDSVQRWSGVVTAIDDNLVTLATFNGATEVKRLVSVIEDLKVIEQGVGWVLVEIPTRNLLRDSQFGDFAACWLPSSTTDGVIEFLDDATAPVYGGHVCRITVANQAVSTFYLEPLDAASAVVRYAVNPGDTIETTLWLLRETGNRKCWLTGAFYNSGGAVVSYYAAVANIAANGNWEKVTSSMRVPSGAVTFDPTLEMQGTGGGGSCSARFAVAEVRLTGLVLHVGNTVALWDTDVLETRDVLSVAKTSDTIQLQTAFDQDPAAGELFLFSSGTTAGGLAVKIIDISKRADHTVKLTGIEYHDELYDEIEPGLTPSRSGYGLYGPVRPTAASTATSGAESLAWQNPTNALLPDAQSATVASGTGTFFLTQWLKLLNFFPRIMAGELVSGIQFDLLVSAPLGTVTTYSARLVIDGVIQVESPAVTTTWTETQMKLTIGGPDEDWGLGVLNDVNVAARLNSATFGLALMARLLANSTAAVDSCTMTVWTSKGADSAVTGLVASQDVVNVDGVFKERYSLGWKLGKTTMGADIYLAVGEAKEQFFARTFEAGYTFDLPLQVGVAVSGHVIGFDRNNQSAPYGTAPDFDLTVQAHDNLLTNSTFRGNLSGWTLAYNTVPTDAILGRGDGLLIAKLPYAYLQAVSNINAYLGKIFLSQDVPVPMLGDLSVAKKFIFSAYFDVPTGAYVAGSAVGISVSYSDDTGNHVVSASLGITTSAGTGNIQNKGWQRVHVHATLGASTAALLVSAFITGPLSGYALPTGAQVHLSRTMLELSDKPEPSTWVEFDTRHWVDAITNGSSTPNAGQGSIPPTVVSDGLHYDVAASVQPRLTFSPIDDFGITISLPDGASTQVVDGNWTRRATITEGIYYALPYFDLATLTLRFVEGDKGLLYDGPDAGKFCLFSAKTPAGIAAQSSDGRVPLSAGYIAVTIPSLGNGGTGGGGGSECPREGQKLMSVERGLIDVIEGRVGEEIVANESGLTTRITAHRVEWGDRWVEIILHNGRRLVQTPESKIPLADGTEPCAEEVRLGDLLRSTQGYLRVDGLHFLRDHARKAVLCCEPVHEFLSGDTAADVVSHNIMSMK